MAARAKRAPRKAKQQTAVAASFGAMVSRLSRSLRSDRKAVNQLANQLLKRMMASPSAVLGTWGFHLSCGCCMYTGVCAYIVTMMQMTSALHRLTAR